MNVLLKTLLFTLIAPGTVTVLVPYLLLGGGGRRPAPIGPLRWLGLIPLAVGAAVYAWCAFDFARIGRGTPSPTDPPKALVARGLYRYTRNPMYLGITSILLGEALLFASPTLAAYALMILGAFHLRVVQHEEPALAAAFGDAFESYRTTVPRWLPRLRKRDGTT